MQRGLTRALSLLGCALLLTVSPRTSVAQEVNCDAGDLEVRKLSFSGNDAFTDTELSKIIVTDRFFDKSNAKQSIADAY